MTTGDSGLAELFFAVSRRLRHFSRESLEPLDVSPSQARALGVLMRHSPRRPSSIAEHLRIAARSATEVVDDLQARGLVERTPDPADRRAVLVALTPAGQAVGERMRAAQHAEADRFFEALDPADRAELERLLRKLRD